MKFKNNRIISLFLFSIFLVSSLLITTVNSNECGDANADDNINLLDITFLGRL